MYVACRNCGVGVTITLPFVQMLIVPLVSCPVCGEVQKIRASRTDGDFLLEKQTKEQIVNLLLQAVENFSNKYPDPAEAEEPTSGIGSLSTVKESF